MLAARREHDAEMELLQPVLTNLYMAESFQDKKHMEGAMATVKETLRVDGEMADKIQRLPQEAKARVDASSLDQQTRDDFMRGVEKAWGSSEILSCYREVHSSEEQWGATTIDLFNFALQHAAAIKTKHRKIVIANPALLSQFNEKFNNSRNLRLKLHEANQRLAATQAAAMKKLGVTKSDLGLDKK